MRTLTGLSILMIMAYCMFMYPVYTFPCLAIVAGVRWVVRRGK
jgi:hypothetical protein